MRDIICASCNGTIFSKGEKVIAFNWFDKNAPFNFGTYIEKYSEDKKLSDDENCRKIETKTVNIYNIGEYKVKKVLSAFALISQWERQDSREKRERKN